MSDKSSEANGDAMAKAPRRPPRWHQNRRVSRYPLSSHPELEAQTDWERSNGGTRELREPPEVLIEVEPGVSPNYRLRNVRSGAEVLVRTSRHFWWMLHLVMHGLPQDAERWWREPEAWERQEADIDLFRVGIRNNTDTDYYGRFTCEAYVGGLSSSWSAGPYVWYYQPPLPGLAEQMDTYEAEHLQGHTVSRRTPEPEGLRFHRAYLAQMVREHQARGAALPGYLREALREFREESGDGVQAER